MQRTEGSTRCVEPTAALFPHPRVTAPPKRKTGETEKEREKGKRDFVPLSLHCRSSKDQSLLKINLKENFWCILRSLVVDKSAAGSVWSYAKPKWDYLKVSVVLWLTGVYFIFYMTQSQAYTDNILLLLFDTWISLFLTTWKWALFSVGQGAKDQDDPKRGKVETCPPQNFFFSAACKSPRTYQRKLKNGRLDMVTQAASQVHVL